MKRSVMLWLVSFALALVSPVLTAGQDCPRNQAVGEGTVVMTTDDCGNGHSCPHYGYCAYSLDECCVTDGGSVTCFWCGEVYCFVFTLGA